MVDSTKAEQACLQLIAAYRRGKDRGDSIDWDDVDLAYTTACQALGVDPDEPENIQLDRIKKSPLNRILATWDYPGKEG